jgi:aminoglycoside phosphotransferase (APT) family kinase protein
MTAEPGVPQTSARPGLVDEDRVRAWLEREAGIRAPFRARRVGGGNSNATYLLEAGERRLVLRRPPAAAISGTAHSMEREHRILRALAGTPVPVPRPVAYCADPDVTGAPFLVMEHVAGVSLTDQLPDDYGSGPDAVRRLGEQMIDALAALHSIDYERLGLADFGRPEGFLERQVSRWSRQYESYAVRDLPRFGDLAKWLEANRPPAGPAGVLHGDFHLDNCLFSPHEPRLLAVIDWEMATVGDPLIDVGLALAFWGRRPLEACAMPRIQGVTRVDGAPTREELAARYAARSGRSVRHLRYYMSLAFWKLAAIVEGAYAQLLDGQLDSEYARGLAEDVPRLLEEAWRFAIDE